MDNSFGKLDYNVYMVIVLVPMLLLVSIRVKKFFTFLGRRGADFPKSGNLSPNYFAICLTKIFLTILV
jgi:hypothetical protein